LRAAIVDRYGGPEVVRVAAVPRPEPRRGEVLVRVHAAAVTSADARIRAARFPRGFGWIARLVFGVRRPRRSILGTTFAGVVEAPGDGVRGFTAGQRVCGMTGLGQGAHAEFVAVRADRIARTPANVSDDDAAGVLFGGTSALFFLRDKVRVAPGSSILVHGAAGAVGTNAVQLARHFGARVTAVTSGGNDELVRRLGAADVIDYTTVALDAASARFDIVFDAVGNLTIASGRRLLRPGGTLVLAAATLGQTLRARGDVVAGTAPERVADFEFLLQLVASRELAVVHDLAVPLASIVDAYRRVDTGHKRGNVLVRP